MDTTPPSPVPSWHWADLARRVLVVESMSGRIAMVIALSLAACGSQQKAQVEDSRLVRLPPAAREGILDDERNVRVAETNLEAARVAEREAKDYQSIVDNERNAARQQLEAAQKAQKLGQSANDTKMQANARDDGSAAQARVRAVDAKMEYAEQLVGLRAEIVKQRQAELEAARAELESKKVTQLVSAGQGEGLDQGRFDRAAVDTRKRADQARQRVMERRTTVEARKATWQTARGEGGSGIDDAPPPPRVLD